MLITNVSLRPPRAEIAADIAEAIEATDATATGQVVFATLVDDPANVLDIVDAYSGEIMLEAASAVDTPDAAVPAILAADVVETATAAEAPDATVGVVPWTPADLGSALRAWYKFNTLTGSNGDPQGAVTDASGNGFNLTQTGTARPTLAVAEQNSLNTLRFDPSVAVKYYQLNDAIFSGLTAGSAYIVYKIVSDAGNNGLMDWGADSQQSHWPYSDGVIYIDFGSTVRKTVGNPSVTQTTYRIISVYSAASDWAFYIDGGAGGSSGGTSPFYSTATNTVGWATSPASAAIGASKVLNGLNGSIAEVVFTNGKQSTTDRQKMEGYLAHKWGLTGNLSASHPYKTTAP